MLPRLGDALCDLAAISIVIVRQRSENSRDQFVGTVDITDEVEVLYGHIFREHVVVATFRMRACIECVDCVGLAAQNLVEYEAVRRRELRFDYLGVARAIRGSPVKEVCRFPSQHPARSRLDRTLARNAHPVSRSTVGASVSSVSRCTHLRANFRNCPV